ncbi:MAG: hypothetical protein KKA73_11885 [Chloroflexi bacterium]|nr:hypothetical protein [Chloroflexota bacterium]MBU1748380.1 hypothetical protein [Chloroflexota bacterium]
MTSDRTVMVQHQRVSCLAPCRTARSAMQTIAFQVPGQAAARRRGRIWGTLSQSPLRFLCHGRLGTWTWGFLQAVV